MTQPDELGRVLEEWLQLPESRRLHATDVVVFAYRLLQERPELLDSTALIHDQAHDRTRDETRDQAGNPLHSDLEASLARIVNWLLPHLNKMEPGRICCLGQALPERMFKRPATPD